MYDTDVSIELRSGGDQVSIIDVKGGLTAAAETAILDAYSQATAKGARLILLGFNELTYLNSAGIGLLVRLVIRAQRQSQRVQAFGLQGHFRRIFELTKLHEVIQFYDTESEATTALRVSGS